MTVLVPFVAGMLRPETVEALDLYALQVYRLRARR